MNSSRIFGVLGLLLLAVSLAVLFWGTFSQSTHFFPPADGAPFVTLPPEGGASCFSLEYWELRFSRYWGGWGPDGLGFGSRGYAFYPQRLLFSLIPLHPLDVHVAQYILNIFLVWLGAVYLLKGHGLKGSCVYIPALAMCFTGYFFTLVSAGHYRIFDMMPFALFMLGTLHRGILKGSVFHYVLAGLCAGYGLIAQADIMVLFGLLSGCYALFLLLCLIRYKSMTPSILAKSTLLGLLVAGGFCTATGLSGVDFLSRRIKTREDQSGTSKQAQWIFATNWSMPPEELIEFVAPALYGYETGDPKGYYWGRVGRTKDWMEHRQGLRNLRQHTVYMGALPLLFALYGLVTAFQQNRRHYPSEKEPDDAGPLLPYPAYVFFWSGAFVISVVLAMGRYTPLYKLFYLIPYCAKIRAPIKFLHVSEVCLCLLFGFGLAYFIQALTRRHDPAPGKKKAALSAALHHVSERTLRTVGFLALGGFVLLVVSAAFLPGSGLITYWQDLGFSDHLALLKKVFKVGLLHGAILFLVGALCFLLAGFYGQIRTVRMAVLAMLWIAVPADLVMVGKHYVRTGDVTPWYAPNYVAESMLEAAPHARTAFLLGPSIYRNWVWGNFFAHGIDMTMPMQKEFAEDADVAMYYNALAKHPLRLWQISSTAFVAADATQHKSLVAHPSFEVFSSFTITQQRIQRTDDTNQQLVLRFKDALPRAAVYHQWETFSEEEALNRLPDAAWNPALSVMITGGLTETPPGGSPSPARITYFSNTRVTVETEMDKPGVLLLNDRFTEDWKVAVNGKPDTLHRGNYIMRSVWLPAGKHRVTFTFRPYLGRFILSFGALLAMLGWALARWTIAFRRS